VAYDKDKVVGDPRYARQVQYPVGGRQQIIDYLPWLTLDAEALNREQVTTAELNRLNFASAGALAPAEKATTTFTALVTTSPQSELIDADEVRLYPDPIKLAADYKSGGEGRVLAARIEGPPSAPARYAKLVLGLAGAMTHRTGRVLPCMAGARGGRGLRGWACPATG